MTIMRDGFSTLIGFSENLNVSMKEVTVKPPGFDGGGAIDTTSMRNTAFRTRYPKALVTLTDCTLTVQYDPAFIDEVYDMLNVNQEITVEFPDGELYTFAGWINLFDPQEHREGEVPLANLTIIPSNVSTVDPDLEDAPDLILAE